MAPSFSALSFSLLLVSISMVCNGQVPFQSTMVFYLQDIGAGPNATVTPVTGINGREGSYDQFGTIFAVDDPMMMSPNPISTQVGRAQGMLIVSAHDASNVNVVLSIVFTNLQYSGSTLEIQGIIHQRESYKEVSVVSGTGRFRFARGYAALETVFYDAQSAHSIIRLTITLRQS
ncbi:Dirigent protein 2, partial [Mucuna pruriens]